MTPVITNQQPRIVAFEQNGRRIGIAIDGHIHDVSERVPDIGVAAGLTGERLVELAQASKQVSDLADARLLAPVDRAARIFCIALNYRAHAEESGGADPGRPVIFHKLDSSLIGPYDDIVTPGYTDFLDYEAELAVVIGRTARRVDAKRWGEVVGGYTVLNDVSCRDAQATKLGDQTVVDWFSAKEADDTTPVGPWIVPSEEIRDPQALRVTLERNGELLQDAPTSLMIFDIPHIIEFLSQRVTLRPGDMIATGTPGGVGKARGIRLEPGDVIVTEVSGIGRMSNTVVAPAIA